MDPNLKEIWSALHMESGNQELAPEATAPEMPLSGGPTPEVMRHQASVLAGKGLRREAADLLRSAVNLAEEMDIGPREQIPLLEGLAEVLWQLGDKREARMRANRAIEMWFRARPSEAFEDALTNADPAASSIA